MKIKCISLHVIALGTGLSMLPITSLASGYHFGSQSVSAQGTAHANSAEANDATTIFYNPAGLTRLDSAQLSVGATVVIPNSSYSDQGSRTYLNRPTGGNDGGTFVPSAVLAPSFYFAKPVNDKVRLGLGLFVPYGAKLDYDKQWAGRYALDKIELETLNLNPTIAFKLNERHSLGFGLSAQYMKANLKKAVDVKTGGLMLFGKARQDALQGNTRLLRYLGGRYGYTLAQLATPQVQGQLLQKLNTVGDGSAELNASNWAWGFNIGYLYQPTENTRLGLAYRSSITQDLGGSAVWDYGMVGDPVLADIARHGIPGVKPGHDNSGASTSVTTPESISANVFHQLNDKFALMGDVTWTRHSRLDKLDIKFDGTSSGDLTIQQNWKDTYTVSLGGSYRYNDKWLWRAGLAYDPTPVPSDTYRHPALPDSDRTWLSFGAHYTITPKHSLDFAYSYVFFNDANTNYKDGCSPVNDTCTGNGETTIGSFQTHMQFVGVQYNYRF